MKIFGSRSLKGESKNEGAKTQGMYLNYSSHRRFMLVAIVKMKRETHQWDSLLIYDLHFFNLEPPNHCIYFTAASGIDWQQCKSIS
jgi:hypothetical protein